MKSCFHDLREHRPGHDRVSGKIEGAPYVLTAGQYASARLSSVGVRRSALEPAIGANPVG